jgi:hypothetical protein
MFLIAGNILTNRENINNIENMNELGGILPGGLKGVILEGKN